MPAFLELLAGRPASFSMAMEDITSPWILLAHIDKVTGISRNCNSLVVVRNTLHVSLLGKLWVVLFPQPCGRKLTETYRVRISEIPLGKLSLLREEMNIITKNATILSSTDACNQLDTLNSLLAKIIGEVSSLSFFFGMKLRAHAEKVCRAHRDILDPLSLSSCLAYIKKYNERSSMHTCVIDYPVLCLTLRVPRSHYFSGILRNHLNPALRSLHESLRQGPERLADAATAWINVFMCCLRIYVPDKPFDPALRPFVERTRHHKRETEFQAKLKALQDFQMILTGQSTSLRSQIVQHKLRNLGEEPQVIDVPRPRVSELVGLCGEFKNLLESIVFRCPDGSALRSFFDGDMARLQEFELLRSNISRFIPRISAAFAAYEDITKPLVAMLNGLEVGLEMAFLARPAKKISGLGIRQVSASTPFLGMQIRYYTDDSVNERESIPVEGLDSQIRFLKNMALYRSVDQKLTQHISRIMCEAFHSIYQDWRKIMEKDKHHSATTSSIYRYRGAEADAAKIDERDFLDCFPDFTETRAQLDDVEKSRSNQRSLAQQLAGCHEDIFRYGKSTTDFILTILEEAGENIGKLWLPEFDVKACEVPTGETVCAVVLALSNHQNRLNRFPADSKLYNFYVDTNLVEVKKLLSIVQRVQIRFSYLAKVWPEHATIKNVLQTSSEMMALRHVEPIAKILTKTEQLHGFVHEWQAVASKEYSAINLYDQITNLLIDWRRLELSTWARLLDIEDKKSDDDVESWWFVAYEVIIAVPLSMINSGENIQVYAKQLLATLGEFLANTSIGQYSRRLRLIGCFKQHIELLSLENHSLKVIHDALVNFIGFYAPSEKFIQDTLREGRRRLEKDMKEVILLASWKDTNIDALRESAKRSHHKLFKIVRKYREVLAQPVDGLIGGKPLEKMTLSGKLVELSASQPLLLDIAAIEISKQYIPYWDLKPARFADPLSTARKIRNMSQLEPNMLGCAFYLQNFADDLVRNIEILRDETPSTVTKENEQSIKHLKTRKKKLYAETLRSIRHLGFQSNLSSSILNEQASWASILGMCPSIPPVTAGICFPEADFHRLLRLMPRARETFRNHSPDLNTRDISRSIGYLESIMFSVIKQRSQLIDRLSDLNHLNEVLSMIQNLWAPGRYTLLRDDDCHAKAVKNDEKVIKWLPGIIGAGCILTQKFAELTGFDSSAIIEALEGWQKQLESLSKAYDRVPILPLKVSSSIHEKTHRQAKDSLSGFKAYLKNSMRENPALGFILRQIELWTEIDESNSNAQTKDELPNDLVDFDITVSNACDSILVAMQRTQKIISQFQTSEDDSSWLPLMDSLYSECLGAFQSRKIIKVLSTAISRTSDVATYDGNELIALGALWATALPIIQQYRNSLRNIIGQYANFHQALCRLASLLGDAFCRIASQGFCDPVEDSATGVGDSEKLEDGMGLADGEGEKDISKDIQDDEDLTELAQGGNRDTEGDISEQEDAVNMDQDELEGEMDDASEKNENQGDRSNEEEMDIDDETGQVDDLDPSAVDERLWDGNAEDTAKEKEGNKETGGNSKNEQQAAEIDRRNEPDYDHPNEEIDTNESDDEHNDQIQHGEAERLNPHLQEEQNLDLPEELDFNDEDNISTISGSDFSSVEDDSVADKGNSQESKTDENANDALSSEEGAEKEEMLQLPEEIGKENSANEPEQAGSPVDTELEVNDGDLEQGLLQDRPMDANTDPNNDTSTKSQRYTEYDNQGAEDERNQDKRSQENEGGKSGSSDIDKRAPQFGQLALAEENPARANGEEEQSKEETGNPAFKNLGDALERWHKRQREIQDSKKEQDAAYNDINDADMAGQDFEHVNDEQEVGDTQALGAATHDQAHALDEQALKSQMQDQPAELIPEEIGDEGPAGEDQEMENFESIAPKNEQQQDLSRSGAIIIENPNRDHPLSDDSTASLETPEADTNELDADLSKTHLQPAYQLSQRTFSEASRLWTYYESLTHSLSLNLTEQLRLILAPTLATKMRGDFRTGKRLNIKRIIPYIASNYKRDKIWMRRSVPSKRAYQVLLAVDDSRSMSDTQGGHLALETLALVAKSLSMLEAGEICIVGFGTDVHVAHPFDRPFSADAGPAMLQHFNFQQPHTDVKKLLQVSLTLFHDARQKSVRSGAANLWQLQLIISDGVYEDHDAIRRLVRNAQEERIVIVFVIVDAGKGDSILDMSQAIFEPDPAGHDSLGILGNAGAGGAEAGATKLRIKRYLDDFPFPFYLVVGDVKKLPGVLATALRQWFAEVVESV
jgi:midasin